MRFYFEFHFDQGEGYLAHLHDPLAAAVALDPRWCNTRTATVDVELTGTLTRGMTIADWSGHWGRHPERARRRRRRPASVLRPVHRAGGRVRRSWLLLVVCPRGTTAAAGSTAAAPWPGSAPSAVHQHLRPRRPPGLARSGSHQRSSTGHGPAHQRNRPVAVRPSPQPHRVGGEHSPAGHPHRIALGVKQFDWIVEQHRRRRLRQLPRPRLPRIGPRHRARRPAACSVIRSAGPRPPLSTGTWTASGPSSPCTRTSARRARSRSSSPSEPHSGSCSASAETTSTGCSRSMVTGRWAGRPAFASRSASRPVASAPGRRWRPRSAARRTARPGSALPRWR